METNKTNCGSQIDKEGKIKIIFYLQGIIKVGGIYRKKYIYMCASCMSEAELHTDPTEGVKHASKCRFRKSQFEDVVTKKEYQEWRNEESKKSLKALLEATKDKQ